MTPLPAAPGSAGARPSQGRSSSGHPALRGLHLDSACAPAVTWQLAGSGKEQDQLNSKCPRFQGNPVSAVLTTLLGGLLAISGGLVGIVVSDRRDHARWLRDTQLQASINSRAFDSRILSEKAASCLTPLPSPPLPTCCPPPTKPLRSALRFPLTVRYTRHYPVTVARPASRVRRSPSDWRPPGNDSRRSKVVAGSSAASAGKSTSSGT
jgi:hypothetical protein